jgi:integrase
MREQTGYFYKDGKKWVARVTYTDASGKRRNVKRYCQTKTDAKRECDRIIREIEERGPKNFDAGRMRFRELAEKYAEAKLIEPVYVDGRKVAGMRSLYSAKLYTQTLVEYFGNRRVKDITHADLETYKMARLKVETRSGKQRTIASVNRELEQMRTILNFAVRQGVIAVSPFKQGEQLIERSAENSRDRVLSFNEEERLLVACAGRRAHLRPLVIAALDTGLRRGELFKLEWQDVDFDARLIQVRAINSKTNRPREVAMTARLCDELQKLSEEPFGKSVFGLQSNVKRSFGSACKEAGIEGLRFHDLRHTCVTGLIEAGMQHTEAMKVSGHTTLSMLNRYLNTSRRARRARSTASAA